MTDLELCDTYRQGQDAITQLCERHKALAWNWAKKFVRHGSTFTIDDFFQECNRALIDTAIKWEPDRGTFSTCATLYMRKRCLGLIKTKSVAAATTTALKHYTVGIPTAFEPFADFRQYQAQLPVIYKLYKQGKIHQSQWLLIKAMIEGDYETINTSLFMKYVRKKTLFALKKLQEGLKPKRGRKAKC